MNASQLQMWIDRLWIVSWQRWMLVALSVIAAGAASTFAAFAVGNQTGVAFVAIIGFAFAAVVIPDSHAPLVVEGLVLWQWLAGTDSTTTPWVIPLALSLFVFHTATALMAVTPISASIDRSVLVRWSRRSVYVVVATVAMWGLVFVMDERRAPGNVALTFAAFVVLTVIVVLTRANSEPPHADPAGEATGATDVMSRP